MPSAIGGRESFFLAAAFSWSYFFCGMLSRTGFATPFIGRGARILNWPPMDNDQTKSHLNEWIARARRHLATRRREKPLARATQSRVLWPEMQIALDDGQSVKAIRWKTKELFLEAAMPASDRDPPAAAQAPSGGSASAGTTCIRTDCGRSSIRPLRADAGSSSKWALRH